MEGVVKPRTHRGRRVLEAREPKLRENDKSALLLQGASSSMLLKTVLKDMHSLKKPLSVLYRKKNMTRPFEDQTSVEFFSRKAECSLFLFASHSKKRPHNLTLGRIFDHHVLDMHELGLESYRSLHEFKVQKCMQGLKPLLLFTGEEFESDLEHRRLKNILIDFFRGPSISAVRLGGLEHVLSFTAINGRIFVRSYRVLLKRSGVKLPRVELEEMGPFLDLVPRRVRIASQDLFKRAMRRPPAVLRKPRKNVSHDPFGSKLGRIHMQQQHLDTLALHHGRALRKPRKEGKGANSENEESESKMGKVNGRGKGSNVGRKQDVKSRSKKRRVH
uniref:Ribosome production factor 2 homolog n=1 Tax=Eptatretus burgeri TaxID=7764 RepID=A0A8C4PYA4_EPTBU